MPRSLTRLGDPRIHVGDTGALLNEVVQFTRNRKLTSLLASLEQGTVLLYVPRHVLGEMEVNLAVYAADRGVDPDAAVRHWREFYLPRIRVVDVPDTWGAGDERVRAVMERHLADAPTARLMAAMAPCHGFIEDGDLTSNGFGNANWLPIAHASANLAQMELFAEVPRAPAVLGWELIKAASCGFARLPPQAQLAISLVAGVLAARWRQSDRATQQLDRLRQAIGKVNAVAMPIIVRLVKWHEDAQRTWRLHQIAAAEHRSIDEQIARILALGPGQGMLAVDVARQLRTDDNLKNRTAMVRDLLQKSTTFTEVTRGRWRLGERASEPRAALPADLVQDWMWRAHLPARLMLPRTSNPPQRS